MNAIDKALAQDISLGSLLETLKAFPDLPLVFQYDIPDVRDMSVVDRLRSRLNPRGAPETVTWRGAGIAESLRTIVRLVFLGSNYPESVPVGNG